VEVLDQRFKTVRVIKETDGNGGVQWDLRDDQGVIVPPGMYFYRVRGSDPADGESESGLRKLMIRR
jgi:flagellar hook assembly protein FlgD